MMRWLFTAFAALVTIGLVVLCTIFIIAWNDLPPLDGLVDDQACVALRADGYQCSPVKIENVPTVFKQALLAAEDEHFYAHKGGPERLIPALLMGKGTGMTITQWVARDFFWRRRMKTRGSRRLLSELLMPFKIELNLSKDQILELYINQTFLGQHAYGFEAAAQTYFGKSLIDITLGEAAMLAGLRPSPAALNPITNPTRAKQRQHYVLERMLKAGFIRDEQYQQALGGPIHTIAVPKLRQDTAD
jgi:penicillin-binding protein 1A